MDSLFIKFATERLHPICQLLSRRLLIGADRVGSDSSPVGHHPVLIFARPGVTSNVVNRQPTWVHPTLDDQLIMLVLKDVGAAVSDCYLRVWCTVDALKWMFKHLQRYFR